MISERVFFFFAVRLSCFPRRLRLGIRSRPLMSEEAVISARIYFLQFASVVQHEEAEDTEHKVLFI